MQNSPADGDFCTQNGSQLPFTRRLHRGAVFTLEQAWQLGLAWYADKLSPDWRRATPADAEAVFASIGLTGDFWRFA